MKSAFLNVAMYVCRYNLTATALHNNVHMYVYVCFYKLQMSLVQSLHASMIKTVCG